MMLHGSYSVPPKKIGFDTYDEWYRVFGAGLPYNPPKMNGSYISQASEEEFKLTPELRNTMIALGVVGAGLGASVGAGLSAVLKRKTKNWMIGGAVAGGAILSLGPYFIGKSAGEAMFG